MGNPVTFYTNRYKNYRLCRKSSGTQILTDDQGRQTTHHFAALYIQFEDYKYTTSNQEEIDFIRQSDCYTGQNGSRIDIIEPPEVEAPRPALSPELQSLVDEFGEDRVADFLKKKKAKLERAVEPEEAPKPKKKKKASVR